MIKNRLFALFVFMTVSAAIALSGILYGYYTSKNDLVLEKYIDRFDGKFRKILKLAQERDTELNRIETTFIRFSGKEYLLPNTNWISGGALTVWQDDLILMIRNGSIHYLDEKKGIIKTRIGIPDNGLLDYVKVSSTKPYDTYSHKANTIRYNDIAFSDTDRFRGLVISYTFFDGARKCYGNRLARLPVAKSVNSITEVKATADDWVVFFETSPCLELNATWTALDGIMSGGRFDIADNGSVVFGSGEFHLDGIHTYDVGIQSTATDYGKVLQIDPVSGEKEILAVGHRNLKGVAIDDRGEIWTVEHAVRGGDELNHIKKGENHGWPLESYGTLYSGQYLPLEGVVGQHDQFDKPAFAWLPSAGMSALTPISNFHPAWDGGLLAGSLSSPEFGQSLWYIRTDDERVVFSERIELKRRIRYVQQFGEKIAIWADPTYLIILEQVDRADPLGDALASVDGGLTDEVMLQVKISLENCQQCHSFEQFQHKAAPSLNGIVGRRIAGTDFDGYSPSLKGASGLWTRERLIDYLDDPEKVAPGGYMPDPNLNKGPVLSAIVETLARADTVRQEHLKYN